MVKKSKLLAALDAHKGRDYEAEKRKKQLKTAERRKREKAAKSTLENGSDNEEDVNGIAVVDKVRLNGSSANPDDDDFEDFSDQDDETSAIDANATITTMPQNTENGDASASEAEVDSDVPLSDLSEEDLEDAIPHQRLTINNGPALLASQKRIAIVKKPSETPFHIHNSLISDLPPSSTAIPDPNDDLTRELEFYRIAREATMTARSLLKAEKIPFTRPADYFAEMVKSDEHMGRVKKKLYDSAASKKASEEARRQRDAKKFGKAVQVAKEQERAKEKRDTLDKIKDLKRKRKGNDTGLVREADARNNKRSKSGDKVDDDLFESITVESAPDKDKSGRERGSYTAGKRGRGGGVGAGNPKRQKKDEKYGFGGKKRHAKSGDVASTGDMRGFSASRMKERGRGRGGGGGRGRGSMRPGKSRRQAAKS